MDVEAFSMSTDGFLMVIARHVIFSLSSSVEDVTVPILVDTLINNNVGFIDVGTENNYWSTTYFISRKIRQDGTAF